MATANGTIVPEDDLICPIAVAVAVAVDVDVDVAAAENDRERGRNEKEQRAEMAGLKRTISEIGVYGRRAHIESDTSEEDEEDEEDEDDLQSDTSEEDEEDEEDEDDEDEEGAAGKRKQKSDGPKPMFPPSASEASEGDEDDGMADYWNGTAKTLSQETANSVIMKAYKLRNWGAVGPPIKKILKPIGWKGPNPVLMAFFLCVNRESCVASMLESIHPALREICEILGAIWTSQVHFTSKAWVPTMPFRSGQIVFPKSTGVDVNMMPIVLGDRKSIPANCEPYSKMIAACCSHLQREEIGKIGYLTISESDVKAGVTHRREGLHTETPGSLVLPGKFNASGEFTRGGIRHTVNWGCGILECGRIKGGIFTANSVPNSLEVWNAQVKNPEDIVGQGGYCEHLRNFLGPGQKIASNTLIWMTDTTPHESVPLVKPQHRQFFRLVSSEVSAWYSQHSTANPLGIVPDPKTTVTITTNKFTGK